MIILIIVGLFFLFSFMGFLFEAWDDPGDPMSEEDYLNRL